VDQDTQSSRSEIARLVVPRVGRVVATGDPSLPWVVLDGAGEPLGAVSEYLRELTACGNTASSCRSYGFDLLRWFRFLAAVDIAWERAGRDEVRDFVLWLRASRNPARERRGLGAPVPGSVNAKTGKAYLRTGYAPATINHALSVISEFYDFHVRVGDGPVLSPVPPQSRGGRMRITTRWNRSTRGGAGRIGRSSRTWSRGRCPTVCSMSCSGSWAATGIGRC
jgi:integrase/recombinase XerC